MNVELADVNVLNVSDNLERFHRIVALIEDEWHSWAGPDPADTALASHLQDKSIQSEVLAKSFVETSAYAGARRTVRIVATPDPKDPWQLTVDDALSYLSDRLEVVVENERNDGRFFRRVLDVIDRDLVKLGLRARPPFRFGQGGGKDEIRKLVEHRSEQILYSLPPRMAVLVDSDARFPGEQTQSTKLLERSCRRHSVPCFVLQKRAIENYLPDLVLRDYAAAVPDKDPDISWLLALSSIQRDHYRMKDGKVSTNPTEVRPRRAGWVRWLKNFLQRADPTRVAADGESTLYAGLNIPLPPPQVPRLLEHYLDQFQGSVTVADLRQRNCDREISDLAIFIRGAI